MKTNKLAPSIYLIAALLLTVGATSCTQAKRTKPNVVVIFTDDLGWTDLSCYGSSFYETPHIDDLAKQGAVFRNAYSACNVCSPTRAALMTGKYPQRVGFTDWLNPDNAHGPNSASTAIPASETTLGEAFQQAGYRTGYIGKWHLGPLEHAMPKQQGFDWHMASAEHGYPGSYFFPYKRGKGFETGDVPDLEDGQEGNYLTDVLTTKAIGFLKETVKQGDKPFFFILGHYAVHRPIEAPEKLVTKYDAKHKRVYGDKPLKSPPEKGESYNRGRQGDTTYAGMVESLDTNVGRVVATLEELGILDDTIIVFTSDNGGESNSDNGTPPAPTSNLPLRAGKGWNYEGGIRVPTFITWPSTISPMSSNEAVITMDIFPTLLELAGLDSLPEQHIDGRSLVPLISGETDSLQRPFLAWRKPHTRRASLPSAAILQDGWKLVHDLGDQENAELYNLESDVGEEKNLTTEQPKRVQSMLKTLNQWVEDTQPEKTPAIFNGKNLTRWSGNDAYWSVEDGAIVGHSVEKIPKNEFLWSDVPVEDFHFSVDVKLTPGNRNAGIQFRSKPIDERGQALGYQADAGNVSLFGNLWGKLYHEHGRGKLDWNNDGNEVVKSDDWNRYEILAVGDRIWTSVNGKLCTAIRDPKGERSGKIAFQIHGGEPQTVRYRNPVLTHNPKVVLSGMNEEELNAQLVSPFDQSK